MEQSGTHSAMYLVGLFMQDFSNRIVSPEARILRNVIITSLHLQASKSKFRQRSVGGGLSKSSQQQEEGKIELPFSFFEAIKMFFGIFSWNGLERQDKKVRIDLYSNTLVIFGKLKTMIKTLMHYNGLPSSNRSCTKIAVEKCFIHSLKFVFRHWVDVSKK